MKNAKYAKAAKAAKRSRYTGELTVQGNAGGNGAEADQSTPHLVNGNLAGSSALADIGGALELRLEAESEEQHDESSDELANALHGEDGTHHGATPLGGSEPVGRVSTMHTHDGFNCRRGTYSEVMMEDRG